jgi:hypothetical protein
MVSKSALLQVFIVVAVTDDDNDDDNVIEVVVVAVVLGVVKLVAAAAVDFVLLKGTVVEGVFTSNKTRLNLFFPLL